MEQVENLELEVLLILRSNKSVPTRNFHELFEKDRALYRSAINRLIVKKYLKISIQSSGACVFELSQKGNERTDEILLERARKMQSITVRIRNFLKRFNQLGSELASHVSDGIGTFHL